MPLILVVDEHSVFRSGLRDVIELKIDQARVSEASSIEDVDERTVFDLVLIDSGSLTQRALRLLKQLHELSPKTHFAVMSTSNTRADVLNCLSAGFHGFVYKLQSDDELLAAIHDLLSGRIYVPQWLADGDENTPEVPPSVSVRAPERMRLTPRQNEILPMLAQGMSNREIARLLNIAEGTTKTSHCGAPARHRSTQSHRGRFPGRKTGGFKQALRKPLQQQVHDWRRRSVPEW